MSLRVWVNRLTGQLIPLLILLAFACGIATYILIAGSGEPLEVKPRSVWLLLAGNVLVLLALLGAIAFRIYQLWSAVTAQSSGSKLQKRVLLVFSIVTILPTIIVSVFSALFFNLGIQTWFNDRVQTAVSESLTVAEAYLSEHKENLRADAIAMAGDLSRAADLAVRDQAEFNRVVQAQSALRVLAESLVIYRNRIIAQGRFSFSLAFEHIPTDAIDRARRGEAVILPSDEPDKVRALVRIDGLDEAYLLVGRLVDSKVVGHMQNAQGAVSEYEQLRGQLDRLQTAFMVIFFTVALLLLLASIGYGTVFAARLTTPISRLASAAERVRGGDFSARVTEASRSDELGMLARSFNRMTEQLDAQRTELIEANRRLDERRRFSEAVLFGVSAGVIALDRDKRITLFNRSASSIFATIDQPITLDSPIGELLPGIHEILARAVQNAAEITDETLTLTRQNKTISLHARITVEKKDDDIEGFIVTFDDITLLLSAQRTAAWADVARRIAHEIKNPLTPIQLSAERLRKKYLKFISEDQESFIRYTDTIIKHVSDIGKMVEEFVSFARMPAAVFASEDAVSLVKKAVFSAQVPNSAIEFRSYLPAQPVMLWCDERQLTQVLTNLFKNACESIDARLVRQPGSAKGMIITHLTSEHGTVKLTIQDNGLGFPEGEIGKLMEPYVTTRAKGMGLGLSIVKKIIDEHKGLMKIENNAEGGAKVTLSFPPHCDINAAIS